MIRKLSKTLRKLCNIIKWWQKINHQLTFNIIVNCETLEVISLRIKYSCWHISDFTYFWMFCSKKQYIHNWKIQLYYNEINENYNIMIYFPYQLATIKNKLLLIWLICNSGSRVVTWTRSWSARGSINWQKPLWKAAWQFLPRALKEFVSFDPVIPLLGTPA